MSKTNKGFVLVVDDLRLFEDKYEDVLDDIPYVYAINSVEAIKILKESYQDIVEFYLDHDLGQIDGINDDITPVINWIEEQIVVCGGFPKLRGIRILTNNPVGFQRIKALERYIKILPTPKHIGLRE